MIFLHGIFDMDSSFQVISVLKLSKITLRALKIRGRGVLHQKSSRVKKVLEFDSLKHIQFWSFFWGRGKSGDRYLGKGHVMITHGTLNSRNIIS